MTDLLENAESREKVEKLKEKVFYGMTVDEIAEAEELEINGCADIEDGCLELLPVLTNLKTLRFVEVQCRKEKWLQFLKDMPNVKAIVVEKSIVRNDDIRIIGSCQQLEELSIYPFSLPTESLMPIIQLTNLRLLKLSGLVGEEFLEILENLPQLEEYYGEVRREALPKFFDLFETFPNLRKVVFGPKLNVKFFHRLTRLKHIDSIDFSCHMITDDQLKEVDKLTELKELFLLCGEASCPRRVALNLPKLEKLSMCASDLQWMDFTGIPRLETLNLGTLEIKKSEQMVNFDTLVYLKRLRLWTGEIAGLFRSLEMIPGLETLEVGKYWKINDQMVRQISEFPAIQEIDLENCKLLTPEGAQWFGACKRLTRLSLQRAVQLTDSGLDFLKDLPNLKELELIGFPVNDYDLRNLDCMTELEVLRITDCSQLTQHTLNRISRLPKLRRLILERGNFPEPQIKDLPNLEKLELRRWTCDGWELSNLPRLEQGDFEDCTETKTLKIQNLPMIRKLNLKNLPNLDDFRLTESQDIRWLDLSCCETLDLNGLVCFQKLRVFSLSWEQLTEYGMRETLHEIPSLRTLQVNCRQMEETGGMKSDLADSFKRQELRCCKEDMFQISKEFSKCFVIFQVEVRR